MKRLRTELSNIIPNQNQASDSMIQGSSDEILYVNE